MALPPNHGRLGLADGVEAAAAHHISAGLDARRREGPHLHARPWNEGENAAINYLQDKMQCSLEIALQMENVLQREGYVKAGRPYFTMRQWPNAISQRI